MGKGVAKEEGGECIKVVYVVGGGGGYIPTMSQTNTQTKRA